MILQKLFQYADLQLNKYLFYYQCLSKQLCCLILWKVFFFFVVHIFTADFDQLNLSLLDKNIRLFQEKRKFLLTLIFWMVVYVMYKIVWNLLQKANIIKAFSTAVGKLYRM